jgi:hypothetical protein
VSDDRSGYVVFVWSTSGYVLREHEGDPPAVGESVDADGRQLTVTKVGASPLPGDRRRCVFTAPA